MKNYVQEGHALDLAAPYDVAAGAGFKVGQFIAVAACAALSGVTVAGFVEGVYDVLAEGAGSGQVWAAGDLIYWDNTAKQFTKTSTSNTKAGYVVAVKASGDVTGRIRLIPSI